MTLSSRLVELDVASHTACVRCGPVSLPAGACGALQGEFGLLAAAMGVEPDASLSCSSPVPASWQSLDSILKSLDRTRVLTCEDL